MTLVGATEVDRYTKSATFYPNSKEKKFVKMLGEKLLMGLMLNRGKSELDQEMQVIRSAPQRGYSRSLQPIITTLCKLCCKNTVRQKQLRISTLTSF